MDSFACRACWERVVLAAKHMPLYMYIYFFFSYVGHKPKAMRITIPHDLWSVQCVKQHLLQAASATANVSSFTPRLHSWSLWRERERGLWQRCCRNPEWGWSETIHNVGMQHQSSCIKCTPRTSSLPKLLNEIVSRQSFCCCPGRSKKPVQFFWLAICSFCCRLSGQQSDVFIKSWDGLIRGLVAGGG